jgi:hypothetical protein
MAVDTTNTHSSQHMEPSKEIRHNIIVRTGHEQQQFATVRDHVAGVEEHVAVDGAEEQHLREAGAARREILGVDEGQRHGRRGRKRRFVPEEATCAVADSTAVHVSWGRRGGELRHWLGSVRWVRGSERAGAGRFKREERGRGDEEIAAQAKVWPRRGDVALVEELVE